MRSRLLGGQASRHHSSIRVSRASRGDVGGAGRRPLAQPILLATVLALTALVVRGLLVVALPPAVSAKSAIVLDLETGKELLSKDPASRIYPASLTKLMTALILAGERSPLDTFRCSGAASLQEPARLGLVPGATVSASSAMDAMLIGSANDAAYMVAEGIGGSIKGFANLMNSKAADLGMRDTHFVTPSGLHHKDHFSTARDLAILFRAALQDPWVSRALAKREVTLTAELPKDVPAGTFSSSATFTLENTNPLLGQDGCTAGKTGSTSDAGKCLAALYERDGRRVIAIVMGAPSSEDLALDMRAVVDAALRR